MTEKTITNDQTYPRNVDTTFEEVRNDPENLLTKGRSIFEAFGYTFSRKLVGAGDTEENTNLFKTRFKDFKPENNDLQVFQPDDPYHEVINTTDQDFIFAYGIQMRYYRVKPREEQKFVNEVYNETANREYYGAILERNSKFAFLTEVSPIISYGLYAPTPMAQEMTNYSIDTSRSAILLFNIQYIRSLLQRDPMIGDVIIPFDLPEQVYEVMTVTPVNKTLYVPRRFQLGCELVQWSV